MIIWMLLFALPVVGLALILWGVTPSRVERERKRLATQQALNDFTRGRGCAHTSVPWPVIAGGDLVAWLCDECGEQRREFRCPPIRYRVVCEHPETTEIRTWGSGVVERWCKDCGQRQMLTTELEAFFRERGEPVPLIPLTERPDPGEVRGW